MTNLSDVLRFCVCCPAPCRSAMPADTAMQAESATPTGLAMIALAVMEDELPLDESTRTVLGRLDGARACVAACPYGHDIPAIIGGILATRR